jgi:hypothetical protein
VIGVLRVIVVLSSGLWFGAAVFAVFALSPASASNEMQQLLGPATYPFYAKATEQVIASRYGYILVFCALVALINLFVVWLYFAKLPGRPWFALLLAMVCLSFCQSLWFQPRLKKLHRTSHAVNLTAQTREKASNSFHTWQTVSNMVNYALVAGLAINLLRVTHPGDPTRFVSAVKFKS